PGHSIHRESCVALLVCRNEFCSTIVHQFPGVVKARAPVEQDQTPTMTSDALITAHASTPGLRPRSATASFVIEAVMTTPWPMSIRTCDVVTPGLTSTT